LYCFGGSISKKGEHHPIYAAGFNPFVLKRFLTKRPATPIASKAKTDVDGSGTTPVFGADVMN
jgi:hypothetical protein